MNLVINIYKNKFSLYSAIFDILAIIYVATFKINPARIIAFYWLDSCVMFIFFMLFFKYIGIITWYFEIFFASFIFIAINFIPLVFVITFSEMAGYKFKIEEAYKIFEPYFDLSPFLSLSGLSNYYFYRKVCRLSDKIEMSTFL
jgi:hypothetical protein